MVVGRSAMAEMASHCVSVAEIGYVTKQVT